MALPTTEVIIFDTSDSFRANPELLVPAFDQLKSEGVNVPFYSGLEAENPNVGFIAINWDSYEHHEQIMAAPFYAEVTKSLRPALAGPPKVYHVRFSAPTVALDQPVTEVLLLTLKTPEKRAALVDLSSKFSEASGGMTVFGQTHEDENKYILISGWPSVEAHREIVAKLETAAARDHLLSLADVDNLYHAKLKKF